MVCMEMDEKRMTHNPFHDPWMAAALVVWLGTGVALGLAYFYMLRRSAELLVSGGHTARLILLVAGRLLMIATGLIAAALSGGLPLLATALGVWAGRAIIVRTERRRAS
jgi:hypothetical protein